MKIYYFAALALLLFACQHQPNHNSSIERYVAGTKLGEKFGKKKVRQYFKNVNAQERLQILATAEVFDPNYDASKVPQADIVADMHSDCGSEFKYEKVQVIKQLRSRHSIGRSSRTKSVQYDSYKWSKVYCDYHPDSDGSMSGGSTKFLCDFADPASKDGKTTKKIRFARNEDDPLDQRNESEVIETTMAFNLARLVGFPTKTFCPAVVSCRGCPSSNPWKNSRASAAPGKKTYEFAWGLIENPMDVYMVSTPNTERAPNGVEWEELMNVVAASESEKRRMLIEREALILWIHFVQNTDAGGFNQRLACLDYKEVAGKYECVSPLVYSHDHGHSFYRHLNYDKWSSIPVFQKTGAGTGCRAGLTADNVPRKGQLKGIMLGPLISAEARDLLLERFRQLTDRQWEDIFQIARGEEATQVKTETWLRDIKNKLNEMQNAQCLPFDSGTSVLFAK